MDATQAQTPCNQTTFGFQALGSRKIEVDFSGGYLSSDGGGLLLREIDQGDGFCLRLSKCFTDHRHQHLVEHPLADLLRQRIHGIALGYEDLNDHERLRYDPVFAATCGREDIVGENRTHQADKGKALAGKSTLNRLELGAETLNAQKKIQPHPEQLQRFLIEEGVKRIPRKSRAIIIDFDATDDRLHGDQEGAFYHGYYGHYCYLPLYAFCGDIPLWAELREANIDGAKGTLEAMQAIIPIVRARFGESLAIIIRADSGFCRDEILTWIEAQTQVYYIIGLAKNSILETKLRPTYDSLLSEAIGEADYQQQIADIDGKKRKFKDLVFSQELDIRGYSDFRYRTQKTWSCERRVIGKAAITLGKVNSRFIVTNLTGKEEWIAEDKNYLSGQSLYEDVYCARGDMENRIKEQQMDMFADRTSTAHMSSNQLRLYFSTFAYMLVRDLRADALVGTRYARASVGQIRLHLFKIAAQLTVSVRRIYIRLASACPSARDFAIAHANLQRLKI